MKKKLSVSLALLVVALNLTGCAASEEEQALEKLQNRAREAVASLEEQQKALDQLEKRPWFGMYASCNKIEYDTEAECVQDMDKNTQAFLEEKKKKLQESIDELNKEFINISV